MRHGQLRIFNIDQSVQFPSQVYSSRLTQAGIQISWDRRGRALDNVFVERLWRSLKWEEVYLHAYQEAADALSALDHSFHFYNHDGHIRPWVIRHPLRSVHSVAT